MTPAQLMMLSGGAGGGGGGGAPATPYWVAVGTRDSTGTSSATPAYGTNAAGDLFVMIVAGRITAFTTPSGWTLQGGPNDQAGRRVYILTRDARSSGGESGTVSVTLTADSMTATIHTIRGVATSSFIEDVTNAGSAANGNTLTAPDITASGVGRLALFAVGSGTNVSSFDEVTGSTGGTWTWRDEFGNPTGTDSAYALYTAELHAGGTIAGGTDTVAAIDEHSVVGLAFKGADATALTPRWIASGTVSKNASSNLTPAYGTNQAGDLFVCQIASYNNTYSTPSGWTLFHVRAESDGFGNTMRNYVFTRDARSTGGESGTVTFTVTSGTTGGNAVIHTFRGVKTSSFIEALAEVGNAGAGPLNCPTVTPGGTRRLAVMTLTASSFGGALAPATGESNGNWVEVQEDNDGVTSVTSHMQVSDQTAGFAISGGTVACTSIFSVNAVAFCLVGVA